MLKGEWNMLKPNWRFPIIMFAFIWCLLELTCLRRWNETCLQKWWMKDKVRLFQLALTPRHGNNFQWMDNRLIWTQKHVRDEKIIQDQDWVGMATFTSTVIVHRMRRHCPQCVYIKDTNWMKGVTYFSYRGHSLRKSQYMYVYIHVNLTRHKTGEMLRLPIWN